MLAMHASFSPVCEIVCHKIHAFVFLFWMVEVIKKYDRFIFACREQVIIVQLAPECLSCNVLPRATFRTCEDHAEDHVVLSLRYDGTRYMIGEEAAKLGVAIAKKTHSTLVVENMGYSGTAGKMVPVLPFLGEMLVNASVVALTPLLRTVMSTYAMSPPTATTLVVNDSDTLKWDRLGHTFPLARKLKFSHTRCIDFRLPDHLDIEKDISAIEFLQRLDTIESFPLAIECSTRRGIVIEGGIVGFLLTLAGMSENLTALEVLVLREFSPRSWIKTSYLHLVKEPPALQELNQLTVSFAVTSAYDYMSWSNKEMSQAVEEIVKCFRNVGIKIRTVSSRKVEHAWCEW